MVGGSAALGAWTLVSVIGSASTGTAISTLSGVAATNATMAWFGGGSLAAGGAGMAGGFWVLGGIVAAPMVYFSTKNSYKKVEKIKVEKEKLIKEIYNVIDMIEESLEYYLVAEKSEEKINKKYHTLNHQLLGEIDSFKNESSFNFKYLGGRMNDKQQHIYETIQTLTHVMLADLGIE